MIDLAERYFAAIDAEDFAAVAATLTADCVFSVETHGVRLEGHDAIRGMLERLWAGHAAVRHEDFVHVAAEADRDGDGVGRIATRFSVVNTRHDGGVEHKSNCNFFEIRDGRFARVAVYMAGENTLNSA